MKLGSSRGTDTRRPRGSERSKPRHKLRLTRPSQRPYPGPPEQAQPGVSEPCRTTEISSATLSCDKNGFFARIAIAIFFALAIQPSSAFFRLALPLSLPPLLLFFLSSSAAKALGFTFF